MPSITFVIAGAYLAVFVLALLWNAATYLFAGMAAILRQRHPPDEASSDAPASVITLVHGTWARRGVDEPGSRCA